MVVPVLLRAKTTTKIGVTIMDGVAPDLGILPVAKILSIIGYKIMAAIARTLVIVPVLVQTVSTPGAKLMVPTDMANNQIVLLITVPVSIRGVKAIPVAYLVTHTLIKRG
jgi:hypothetical protein